MNTLPPHRRALAGRTWATTWRPADADPIEGPRRPSVLPSDWVMLALACFTALLILLGVL